LEKVRIPDAVLPERDPGLVTISHTAVVEWACRIDDLETVHRLAPLHVLDDSLLRSDSSDDTGSGSLEGRGSTSRSSGFSGSSRPSFSHGRVLRRMPFLDRNSRGRSPALVSVLSEEEHARRKGLFSNILGIRF